jgi:hypothetical protein
MKALLGALGGLVAMALLSSCAGTAPAVQGDKPPPKVSPQCQSCQEQRDRDMQDKQNAQAICQELVSTIKDQVDRKNIESQCLAVKKLDVPRNCDDDCRN